MNRNELQNLLTSGDVAMTNDDRALMYAARKIYHQIEQHPGLAVVVRMYVNEPCFMNRLMRGRNER